MVIETSRIPALDAYRATMMLLGLVLHSAVFTAIYSPTRSEFGEDLLYLLFDFIHTFRMPAFFFISGFFAAMLFMKIGVAGLIKHRAMRVLLPLLVFWPAVTLAFQLVFAINNDGNVVPDNAEKVEFYHLWFLSYLIYITFAAIIIAKLLPFIFAKPLKFLNYKISQIALYALATFALAAIPMTLETDGTIKTSSTILPDNSMISFYLIIFLLGWLCFQNQSMLINFKKFWFLFLIVGLVGYFGHLANSEQLDFDYRVVYFGASLSLSFGILGLTQKAIAKPNRFITYISQSSYWIYIVHLPIVILMLTLIDGSNLSIGMRFLTVLLGTTLVSFISYQLLVQNTAIGKFLGVKNIKRG